MHLLLEAGWLDHTAYWAWVAGMIMGGFLGTLLGQWMTWLVLRNPLGCVVRAYRVLLTDIWRLLTTGRWS